MFYILFYFICLHIIISVIFSLFFGQHRYSINISSIRIIETAKNYREIIEAMTLFDRAISDNIYEEISKSFLRKSLLILNHLVGKTQNNEFAPFIHNSWKVFLQKKTEIKINMSELNFCISDLGFLGLIFGGRGLEMHEYDSSDVDNNYVIPDDNDMTNIFALLNLFDNLQTLHIENVQVPHTNKYWSFSLYRLLYLLTKTQIKKVEISTDKIESSWLSYLWGDKSASFIKAYKNKGYAIAFDDDYKDYASHCISIKLV